MRLFNFSRTLEELDEIDVARVARALEALGYDNAFGAFAGGDELRGGDIVKAREMLNRLPPEVRRNVETSRRDLRRGKR